MLAVFLFVVIATSAHAKEVKKIKTSALPTAASSKCESMDERKLKEIGLFISFNEKTKDKTGSKKKSEMCSAR